MTQQLGGKFWKIPRTKKNTGKLWKILKKNQGQYSVKSEKY